MKRKAFVWLAFLVFAAVAATSFLAGTKYARKNAFLETLTRHDHQWGKWEKPVQIPSDFTSYIQFRQCTNCGAAETRKVKASRSL